MSIFFSKKKKAATRTRAIAISRISPRHYRVFFEGGKKLIITREQMPALLEDYLKTFPYLRVGYSLDLRKIAGSWLNVSSFEVVRTIDLIYAGLHSDDQRNSPPRLGEKLLLLILPKKDRECMLGDLAEEYVAHQAKYGTRFAKIWYYKQVIGSAWPMIKKAFRWGIIAWIGDWVRRHI